MVLWRKRLFKDCFNHFDTISAFLEWSEVFSQDVLDPTVATLSGFKFFFFVFKFFRLEIVLKNIF